MPDPVESSGRFPTCVEHRAFGSQVWKCMRPLNHMDRFHIFRPADAQPYDPPHQPRRDDDIGHWLKRMRDKHDEFSTAWNAVNDLLDRYRECSDYGLTLRPEHDDQGDP